MFPALICFRISYCLTLAGVLRYVLRMLNEGDSMVAPALRVLGNMATGSDDLTQVCLRSYLYEYFIVMNTRYMNTTI